MIEFFLRRPIFATVCSLVVLIAGLISIPTLPIAQYPQIAPPVVTVTATYTGANAEAVESAVTTPLEQAINGVEGLRYISSTSANNGTSTITCTFNLGTNLDIAATDVQNAVQSASGRLPGQVIQTGITVSKNSGSFVMALALKSNGSVSQLFLSNYAELNVVNALKRVPGVSNVIIFGQRRYAMRVWLDPKALFGRGLTVTDVLNALNQQNVEVAAGSIGSAPEPANQPFTISVHAEGRLTDPAQFRNIILRANPGGGFDRLGDVARVELGAEDYSNVVAFDGSKNVVGLGVLQLPTANSLQVTKDVAATLAQLSKSFPAGVTWQTAFDSSMFVNESIKEVVTTLLLSILLVVGVIYLFLQDVRSTLIPAVTIPVSLIGAFAAMKIFGFTINTITLFGLTLATGLVVDDAIVVIENIARFIQDKGIRGIEGAAAAMHEVQSAVVASSLVLLAVFVPVAFFPGTTGQLYKQFAMTIAASISISLFASLTLTPVMSARLLRGQSESRFAFFELFNRGLASFRKWYARMLPRLFRARYAVGALFLAALVLTLYLFKTTPTAFIPNEDQGYFIVTIQAPEGGSLSQELAVAKKAEAVIRQQPEVLHVFDVSGFSFTGSAPNLGIMFVLLKPWSERKGYDHSLDAILQRVQMGFFQIPQAQIFAFNPPAIQGVGNFGGFQFELEDHANVGLPALMNTAYGFMGLGNKDPNLTQVFTTFRIDSPQLEVHIDRNKATSIGVPLSDIFDTMQTDIGSFYVNDFNYLNRSYRVYVQAEAPYRSSLDSLQYLYVRSNQGGIVPISGLATTQLSKSAPIIDHYNLFRSIEINGSAAPGTGSGQAIAAMQSLAQKLDPPGVGYEWSGLTLDEIEGGSLSILIFGIGIVFVFLVLAAQYESFVDPLIVLLAVPASILGALLFMFGRHLPSDAYAQVGYVMLIGLASKSAILIVEFANQQIAAGADVVTAAARGAQTRLRPILMTSIAFVFAVVPLVFATGAGSAARHSLGTVVFGGMIVSTILNLAITPVLYVIIKSWSLPRKGAGGSNGRGRSSEVAGAEPTVSA